LSIILFLSSCFLTEDNSNAPDRMASVQGTPEQVQKVQSMIQEIIEQVTMEEFCQIVLAFWGDLFVDLLHVFSLFAL